MGKIKTFVAVQVSRSIRQSASRCIDRLESSGAGYNWVETDNLHVTLNFAGDMDEMEIPDFCKSIKRAVSSHSPFSMTVEGVGAFPNLELPRTIWLGVTEGTEALNELHLEIAEVVRDFGVNKEKNAYVPHLTLGRLRRSGRWNQVMSDAMVRMAKHEAGSCFVEKVAVFSSHMDRMGPTYSVMASAPLEGDQ